jgi:hypothetical protein
MDLGATKVFIHDPKGNNETVKVGLGQSLVPATQEWSILDQLPFFTNHVTDCQVVCASPCEEQVIDITFPTVSFGDCNECGKTVAFVMILQREPNFDISDYLHLTSRVVMSYEPDNVPSGDVTGAALATWFENEFNNGAYDDEHDWFGATAVANADVLTITVPCPNKLDIYPEEGSELTKAAIVVTDPGAYAVLQKDQLQKEFPLIIGYIPGQGPDDTFTGCEDICIITVKGCIPHCPPTNEELLTTSNATHLHTAGTMFHYELFVNSSAAGYAAFVADLEAATGCTIPLQVANTQFAASVDDVAAANTPIDLSSITSGTVNFDEAPVSGSISNGIVTIQFSGINTIAELVTAIDGAVGAGAAGDGGAGVLNILQAGNFNNEGGVYTITID